MRGCFERGGDGGAVRPVGGASHARGVFVAAEPPIKPDLTLVPIGRSRPSPNQMMAVNPRAPSAATPRGRLREFRRGGGATTAATRRRGGRPCVRRRPARRSGPRPWCACPCGTSRGVDGAGDVGRDDVRGFGRLARSPRARRPRRRRGCRAIVGELAGVMRRCARRGGAAGVTARSWDEATRRGRATTVGTRDAPTAWRPMTGESERARGGNTRARRRPCPGRRAR